MVKASGLPDGKHSLWGIIFYNTVFPKGKKIHYDVFNNVYSIHPRKWKHSQAKILFIHYDFANGLPQIIYVAFLPECFYWFGIAGLPIFPILRNGRQNIFRIHLLFGLTPDGVKYRRPKILHIYSYTSEVCHVI